MQRIDGLPVRNEVTVDEALEKSVGSFGFGQRWLCFLASLAWAPAAAQIVLVAFAGVDPVRAHLWTCVADSNSLQQCKLQWDQRNPDVCSLPSDSWRWTARSQSYVSEWDLVCGLAWKAHLLQILFFLGMLLGAVLFGLFAESYGRRRALFSATGMASLGGALTALLSPYWAVAVLRTFTGAGAAGMLLAGFALATEPVGPTWRATASTAVPSFFSFGACLACLLAWLVPAWRLSLFIASGCTALYLLMWPSVSESPRWLLSVNRKGEATAVLAAIASLNKTHLPEAPLADPASTGGANRGIGEVLLSPRLRRRLALIGIAWAVVAQASVGVMLLMGTVQGSLPLNQLLSFAAELPPFVLFTSLIDNLSRRSTFSYLLLQGGVSVGLASFTGGWLQRVAVIAAKFGIGGAFGLAFLFTSELFPSNVRFAALSACMQAAALGGLAGSGCAWLAQSLRSAVVPYIVLGTAATLAGVLGWTLPETLGVSIAETAAEFNFTTRTRTKWLSLRQFFRGRMLGASPFARLAEDPSVDL